MRPLLIRTSKISIEDPSLEIRNSSCWFDLGVRSREALVYEAYDTL